VEWDLGLWGVAVLALMSVAFGVLTQLVFWGHATRWLWLAASVVAFAIGLVVSEVWFGWAAEEDLQPNIDGLSFDEVLLAFVLAFVGVLLVRGVVWWRDRRQPVT
jgi:hypothetical protein